MDKKTPIYKIIKSNFESLVFLKWILIGGIIIIASYIFNDPWLIMQSLKFSSGLGWLLEVMLISILALSLGALWGKGNTKKLSYGDFNNLYQYVATKVFRVASTFFGVFISSILYWLTVASPELLGLTLQSLILSISFFIAWILLGIIDDSLLEKSNRNVITLLNNE